MSDAMTSEDDTIFETVYSLPVLTHSLGIATRTPTVAPNQETKFMPDYGGILETPNSALKNNALGKGFPFGPKSSCTKLTTGGSENCIKTNDCLALVSHLHSDKEFQFLSIRAQNEDLILDTIENAVDDVSNKEIFTAISQSRIPHSHKISGIKLSAGLQKFLQVRSEKKVKTWKFQFSDQIPLDEQLPLELVSTISERAGFLLKDACINQFNETIQGLASDNQHLYQVKLYDLVDSANRPFQTISWQANEADHQIVENEPVLRRNLRGRVVTNFTSSSPALRGIQQLDHIPSHLVNMLVTTDYRTALIDPRQDRLSQIYVDKTVIPSFYPIEYLRRIEFSPRNSYQFYSLSNVQIRVFDTRYPGLPINQVNHMLDSRAYESMNLKLVQYKDSKLETLCLTTPDRLCFSTFDQSQVGSLINPKSVHLPYHEPVDGEFEKLFGLSVTTNLRESNLFAVLQISEKGDILIRNYRPHHEDQDIDFDYESRVERIIHQGSPDEFLKKMHQVPVSGEIEEIDTLTSNLPPDIEPINILESITDLEEKINSLRAVDRFEKMKNKLDAM